MSLPLVLDASVLAELLSEIKKDNGSFQQSHLCLVDLRSAEAYAAGHIPGAVHANAALLNRSEPPMGGLMPEEGPVNAFMTSIGATLGDQIIAYDGGRETAAARLMWVLDAYGYEVGSWLSGGFKAWQAGGYELSTEATTVAPGDLSLSLIGDNVISAEGLMEQLGSDSVKVLDVRSAAEYAGTDVRSAKGGHVPGAAHLEWTQQLDEQGQLLDSAHLLEQVKKAGAGKDDTVIVYCQTHQRSAVTYVALKHLGFSDVRALDGAWSNWGNRGDTPIE